MSAGRSVPVIIVIIGVLGCELVSVRKLLNNLGLSITAGSTGVGLNTLSLLGRLGGDYTGIKLVSTLIALVVVTAGSCVPVVLFVISPFLRVLVYMDERLKFVLIVVATVDTGVNDNTVLCVSRGDFHPTFIE